MEVAKAAEETGEKTIQTAEDTEKVAQTTEEVEQKAVQTTEKVAEKLGTNVVKGVAEKGAQIALTSFAEDAAGTMAEEGEVLGGEAIGGALGTEGAGEAVGEGVETAIEGADTAGEAGGDVAGDIATEGAEDVGKAAAEGVGEAVAEGAGEAGGDFAFAGAAEALGGRPEDPIGDVLALGGLIAGAFSSLFHHNPPAIETITGKAITAEITKLQGQSNAATTAAQTALYSNMATNMGLAQKEGRSVYSVKPTKGGARKMVMTLSATGLRNSIAAVEENPSAFVGVDTNVLTAMGLNPKLSTKAGAEAIVKEAKGNKVVLPYLGGQYAVYSNLHNIATAKTTAGKAAEAKTLQK